MTEIQIFKQRADISFIEIFTLDISFIEICALFLQSGGDFFVCVVDDRVVKFSKIDLCSFL